MPVLRLWATRCHATNHRTYPRAVPESSLHRASAERDLRKGCGQRFTSEELHPRRSSVKAARLPTDTAAASLTPCPLTTRRGHHGIVPQAIIMETPGYPLRRDDGFRHLRHRRRRIQQYRFQAEFGYGYGRFFQRDGLGFRQPSQRESATGTVTLYLTDNVTARRIDRRLHDQRDGSDWTYRCDVVRENLSA